MMLRRKISENIDKWIKDSKNALLIDGARQVGKTYTIRRCLEHSQRPYIEINLVEHPEFIPVIEMSSTVDDLTINLTAFFDKKIEKGTIIFFDEVQEIEDIVTRIKFWVDEGSYKYILSGSLLGIELSGLRSAPVGYLEEIKMYPLDLEEFLWASNVQDDIISYLQDCFIEKKEVSDLIHQKIMTHFKRYIMVGGMPSVVQKFIETRDLNEVSFIQNNIIELYKLDFSKYEKKEKRLKLVDIYDQMPSQLLMQNRRFNYSSLKKGLRFDKVEDSFLWLYSAGVALPVFNATEPRIALNQNAKKSLVKLYYSDTGLLTARYGNAIRAKILADDNNINLGGIYENVVAQELKSHGFETYFYNSNKMGELDFVIEKDLNILPIEVKSGKDYYYHSAISNVVSNTQYEIKEAYVFSNYNISTSDRITYYPIYMVMFIKNDDHLPILDEIIM